MSFHQMAPTFTFNNDNAQDVQRKALEYFKASTFTSYTELTPDTSVMNLHLEIKNIPGGKMVKDTCLFRVDAAKCNSPHILDVHVAHCQQQDKKC